MRRHCRFLKKLGVPKNGVSRSKHLLKPQPLPHQYWVLELRTSLTGVGMVRY